MNYRNLYIWKEIKYDNFHTTHPYLGEYVWFHHTFKQFSVHSIIKK